METQDFSPEKSLQLITEVINKSRRDFMKHSGRPMIVWGITVLITAIAVWYTWSGSGNANWNLLWFAMIPIGYLATWFTRSKETEHAKNHLGSTLATTWIVFGIIACTLAVISTFVPISPSLTTLILLLMGFSTTLTGAFLKNAPILIGGGLTALAGTPVSLIVASDTAPLVMGTGAILSLIIPGLIMNHLTSKVG